MGSRNRVMILMIPRKVLWVALAGGGCLALLLLVLLPKPRPGTLDLRIAGQPQMTNGAMFISIVLSNGTSRSLNIVDDATGNPFVVLDAGVGSNMPGTIGTGLGAMVNSLKLNLAPGATLTKAVTVTNPPSRFRLLVEVRDLARERQWAVMALPRFLAVKAGLAKPTPHNDDSILLPASPWIENGSISTLTQTPTNGSSR